MIDRRMSFLAKSDYFTGKGLKGWATRIFMKATGQLPIDRSGGKASEASLNTGLQVLGRGDLLGIYPEGTRSPDGTLYRGRTGIARMALEAHVPVVPVVMVDTDTMMPIGTQLPRVVRIGIVIGEPLDFSRFEGMEGDRYILRSVTDEIMVALQRLGEQQYDDVYASTVKDRQSAARLTRHRPPRPTAQSRGLGGGAAAIRLSGCLSSSDAAPDHWRALLPIKQQPAWPDADAVAAVSAEIATLPPLVFAGEVDNLRDRLARAASGRAFLLQGGDCAETFAGATAEQIRNRIKTVLQMAVVLTYGASMPDRQDGPHGGAVRQAPLERHRDPRRRHAPRLPRRHRQRVRLHRGIAARGPAAAAEGLPHRGIHHQSHPRVHPGWLRRPARGALLEQGLRREPGQPEVRAPGAARSTAPSSSWRRPAPTSTSCAGSSSTRATRAC